jgi:hypothetical protein
MEESESCSPLELMLQGGTGYVLLDMVFSHAIRGDSHHLDKG